MVVCTALKYLDMAFGWSNFNVLGGGGVSDTAVYLHKTRSRSHNIVSSAALYRAIQQNRSNFKF